MTILLVDQEHMFTIFEKEDAFFLTAVSGGVAQYGITISLAGEEARALCDDRALARRTVRNLLAAPEEFEDRRVRPSIMP